MRKTEQPTGNAKSHGDQKRPEFRNFHLPPCAGAKKKGPGISDVYAKVSLASLRPVAIPGLRHAVDITRVTRTQLLPLWGYCIASGFFRVKKGNNPALNTTSSSAEKIRTRQRHTYPAFPSLQLCIPVLFIRPRTPPDIPGPLVMRLFRSMAAIVTDKAHLPRERHFRRGNRKQRVGLPSMG